MRQDGPGRVDEQGVATFTPLPPIPRAGSRCAILLPSKPTNSGSAQTCPILRKDQRLRLPFTLCCITCDWTVKMSRSRLLSRGPQTKRRWRMRGPCSTTRHCFVFGLKVATVPAEIRARVGRSSKLRWSTRRPLPICGRMMPRWRAGISGRGNRHHRPARSGGCAANEVWNLWQCYAVPRSPVEAIAPPNPSFAMTCYRTACTAAILPIRESVK